MDDISIANPAEPRAELARTALNREFVPALRGPTHADHRAANAHRRTPYASADSGGTTEGKPVGPISEVDAAYGGRKSEVNDTLYSHPDSPKDYRFDPAPHGLTYDIELERKARGWFHQAGIPQWLARNIVREWNRSIEKRPDPPLLDGAAAAAERSLRRGWGDRYDSRVAAAQSLVRSLESAEVLDLLDRSGLANNEYLIRQLAALAENRKAVR